MVIIRKSDSTAVDSEHDSEDASDSSDSQEPDTEQIDSYRPPIISCGKWIVVRYDGVYVIRHALMRRRISIKYM